MIRVPLLVASLLAHCLVLSVASPYGIVYRQLTNSVIANNALHDALMRELLVDLGKHGGGVVVKDNPGRVTVLTR